jgi:hypothetical protein
MHYAAGILCDLDSPVIAINAWRDHIHLLFGLSKNYALSQAVMERIRTPAPRPAPALVRITSSHKRAGKAAARGSGIELWLWN